MTSINNAAALERIGAALFGKDLYAVLMDVQNGIDSPGLVSMANSAIRRIDAVRDEFVTLRATLAQPDALTSQPSGEAVGFDTDQWIKSIVDDGMIDIAIEAYNTNCEGGQRAWMRSALIAALKGVNND